jgi:hypothetical protein
MRAFQRVALERELQLDDNDATRSPFEPVSRTELDVLDEIQARERSLGLPEGWQAEFFPKVMPASWKPVARMPECQKWINADMLTVIISAAVEQDHKRWLHVSCSRPKRLPNWDDLKLVKRLFVGRDREAIQILPAEARYVNQHPYVLHMFACLDSDSPLPDFTHGIGRI